MALWAKNKANFSVAFTEDAADQTLMAAIEKELAFTKYQTFSNLCNVGIIKVDTRYSVFGLGC